MLYLWHWHWLPAIAVFNFSRHTELSDRGGCIALLNKNGLHCCFVKWLWMCGLDRTVSTNHENKKTAITGRQCAWDFFTSFRATRRRFAFLDLLFIYSGCHLTSTLCSCLWRAINFPGQPDNQYLTAGVTKNMGVWVPPLVFLILLWVARV